METDNWVSGHLITLFEEWSGEKARTISALPESGSYRYYVRISSDSRMAVGVHYPDLRENQAFIGFARHFRGLGLPVPELYAVSSDGTTYLQEDLGDVDLFTLLHDPATADPRSEERIKVLTQVIEWLPVFQVEGHQSLDYSLAYPRRSFDRQSMLWDLNYFKYNFLKLVRMPFDEQALEDDFHVFTDFLCQAPTGFFLYRDFQSRNIMIRDGRTGFIDFQGGRMGFPAYDLASLLFDAKAGFEPAERDWMYRLYRERLAAYDPAWGDELDRFFAGFILVRKLQALGAFGFRGLIENKKSFLLSIPPALANLDYVTAHYRLEPGIPELWRILNELPHCPGMKRILQDIRTQPFGS